MRLLFPIFLMFTLFFSYQSRSSAENENKRDANGSTFAAGLNSSSENTSAGGTMTPSIHSSQQNHDVIAPVEGVDISKLGSDVFMRYQGIKLAGDGCSSNSRFLLYDDGRLFMQQNSAKDDCAARPANTRYNKPFDSEPTMVLDAEEFEAIQNVLAQYRFDELPASISPKAKDFDGSMQIMEVRTGKHVKRIISVQSASKAIEAILEVIWAQVY